jgi:hypothetical protein
LGKRNRFRLQPLACMINDGIASIIARVGTPTHISWLPDYEVKGHTKKLQWSSSIDNLTFADGAKSYGFCRFP